MIKRITIVSFLSLWLIVLLAAYQYRINLITDSLKGYEYGVIDFNIFYNSGKAVLKADKNIYRSTATRCIDIEHQPPRLVEFPSKLHSLNPPFFSLLMTALSALPYEKALSVWLWLGVLASISGVLLLQAGFNRGKLPYLSTLTLVVAVLSFYPSFVNTISGQLGSLVVVLAYAAWLAGRNQRDRLAGMLLGILFSIKLFAGIFLLLFFAMKRWQLLRYFIATFICCSLLPLLVMDKSNYLFFYQSLKGSVWYASSINGSIYGLLARFFGTVVKENNVVVYAKPILTPILYGISSGCLIFFLLQQTWRKAKANEQLTQVTYDYGFALCLILMLLISPFGWAYYFPCLLLSLVLILQWRPATTHPRCLGLLTLLCLLLASLPTKILNPAKQTQLADSILWCSHLSYSLLLLLFLLWFAKTTLKQQADCIQHPLKYTPLHAWMMATLMLLTFFPQNSIGAAISYSLNNIRPETQLLDCRTALPVSIYTLLPAKQATLPDYLHPPLMAAPLTDVKVV